MTNKIVQLVPWRDWLLALTEQGEIYRLADMGDANLVPMTATLLFPGIPRT